MIDIQVQRMMLLGRFEVFVCLTSYVVVVLSNDHESGFDACQARVELRQAGIKPLARALDESPFSSDL